MDSTKDPLLVPMKSGKSLLLDLPAEIRLIIYGYILTSPNGYIEPISVWSYDRSVSYNHPRARQHVFIPQTVFELTRIT